MPEIYTFFFDLGALLKLFPQKDTEFLRKLAEYEEKVQEDMAQNRLRLFNFDSEFEKV